MKNNKKTHNKNIVQNSNLYLFLIILFVSSIISANTVAVKIISIIGFVLPAGVIVFPISYIIGDVLTEVYGFKKAKKAIMLGFIANLMFVLTVTVAKILPSAPVWNDQENFIKILGQTPRILTASLFGYLFGSVSNSLIMSKLKKVFNGKMLWIRTISSTVVGEGVDSLVFITIAFFSKVPNTIIYSMVINQWFFKTAYETIATPITYLVVSYIKRVEKIDKFDNNEDYKLL
jgi:uncharacterized integral membrane protein (TIGR00697 family)